jgi:hypothetical protein
MPRGRSRVFSVCGHAGLTRENPPGDFETLARPFSGVSMKLYNKPRELHKRNGSDHEEIWTNRGQERKVEPSTKSKDVYCFQNAELC